MLLAMISWTWHPNTLPRKLLDIIKYKTNNDLAELFTRSILTSTYIFVYYENNLSLHFKTDDTTNTI
jgi:hypothetical protein